ncbi:hypothetical protein D3C78_998240 [compost metagenome]
MGLSFGSSWQHNSHTLDDAIDHNSNRFGTYFSFLLFIDIYKSFYPMQQPIYWIGKWAAAHHCQKMSTKEPCCRAARFS